MVLEGRTSKRATLKLQLQCRLDYGGKKKGRSSKQKQEPSNHNASFQPLRVLETLTILPYLTALTVEAFRVCATRFFKDWTASSNACFSADQEDCKTVTSELASDRS